MPGAATERVQIGDVAAGQTFVGEDPTAPPRGPQFVATLPLVQSPHVLERATTGQRRVLLDARGVDSPVTLEGSGPRVWDAFHSPVDTASVTETIAAEFGVPTEDVCNAVREFVTDLLRRGLLATASPPEKS